MSQRGQAVALIALMITVLIGMVALAVDGARAYALRRDLQAAVDAAALSAGDTLQQTRNYASAEQAATSIFASNLRLYAAPSCTPAYGSPGASPLTITCTFSDGTVFSQQVSALGAQGTQFKMNAQRPLQLSFAGLLTNGANPTLSDAASGSVNNLRYSPAVAALNQAGCAGAGNALTINGSGTLSVNGDVVADGMVTVTAGSLAAAGDVYARCQSSIASVVPACYPSGAATPCSYPDVAGAVRSGFRLADPAYPAPAVPGPSQAAPGPMVVLNPGSYAANPNIAPGRCYFLSAGVYAWRAGYTANGGLVSNELKPPDEPDPNNNLNVSAHQFWNSNGVNCAGSFKVSASVGAGWSVGTYGFELTSLRSDPYSGVSYSRESAPSRCDSLTLTSGQTVTLQVSNVPGATSYNIYMSQTGCTGPFGLVYNLPVSGTPENDNVGGCPWGLICSLGQESVSAPAFVLASLPGPNPAAAPGTAGAYPPDGETAPLSPNLPNQNPARGTPPAGARANENQCDTTTASLAACPAAITPGAVVFYISSGGCLNTTGSSDTFIFSGYQYDWISVYEPPANTCANVISAASNSAFIGLVYMPAASLNVQSSAAFLSRGMGGLIADKISFTGTMPAITYSASYAPIPPASRLSY